MMPHAPYPRRPAVSVAARPASGQTDLQSQFEALLDSVWKAEADWRFNDRLDMALKIRREGAAA